MNQKQVTHCRFIILIQCRSMKFFVLVFIFNVLVCGNANEAQQLANSLVNSLKFKSNLDPLLVDNYVAKVYFGPIRGFHFVYELELSSIEITGFGEIDSFRADVVSNEIGDHKLIVKFSFGKEGKIKSGVSINGFNSTLITVDIEDELAVELSILLNAKSDSAQVKIADLKQIRLHPLPNVSPLKFIEDKMIDAFIKLFNTKAKPKLVNLIREIVEGEFKKINEGY